MTPQIQSIIDIIKSCDSMQMATFGLDGFPDVRHLTNAMNRNAGQIGDLYFMTGITTPKYQHLISNPRCCLYYFNPETRYAVRLFGTIEMVHTPATRSKYWRDEYTRFGYTGADDENMALMHFVPHSYKFYVGGEMQTGLI